MSEPLSAAQAAYDQAGAVLRREEVLEELRSRPRLAYASIGSLDGGPYLVTWDGVLIGEVSSETPGAVGGWFAVKQSDGTTSDPKGPFHTIRQAAASMTE